MRHLALEIGRSGINVNIVQAGLVQTDSFRLMPNPEQVLEKQRAKNLVGDRTLEPRDVADAVLYLSSSLSDMVQGQTLVVDAGAAITV